MKIYAIRYYAILLLTLVFSLFFSESGHAQLGALKDKLKKAKDEVKDNKLPENPDIKNVKSIGTFKMGDRVRALQENSSGTWEWGTIKKVQYEDNSSCDIEFDFEKGSLRTIESKDLEKAPLEDPLKIRTVYLFDKWFETALNDAKGTSGLSEYNRKEAERQLKSFEELIRPGENPGIVAYIKKRRGQFDKVNSDQDKQKEDVAQAEDLGDLLKDAYYLTDRLTPNFTVHFRKRESEQFLENAQKLDFVSLKDKIDKSGNKTIKSHDHYKDVIVDFPIAFEKYIHDYLVDEINRNIETSYTEKAKGVSNAGQALEALQIAMDQCKAGLLILPQQKDLLTLQKQSGDAYAKFDAELSSKLYTGPFHKEHKGSIVFSGAPIALGKEQTGAISSSFKAGESIYAAAYLKGTVKELLDARSGVQLEVQLFLDNSGSQGNESVYTFSVNEELTQKTAFELDIIPGLNAIRMPLAGEKFSKVLSACSPRIHKVTIGFYGIDGTSRELLAEGSFQLDCSEGQDKLAALGPKLKAAANASVTLPKAVKTDPRFQAEMLEASKDFLNGWRPGTPVKAVITYADWDIVRHEITGAVLKRTTNGVVAVKHTDGTCKFYRVRFAQHYVGGKFGKTVWDSRDDGTDIACENIK